MSTKLQKQIAYERSKRDGIIPFYVEGDLVLFDPREENKPFRKEKLGTKYFGPFVVKQQLSNEVWCEHVISKKHHKFFVEKVRPFFGNLLEGEEAAKRDEDQWSVLKVNFFSGNVHLRDSLSFNLDFEMGFNETLSYNKDTKDNFMIKSFVSNRPWMKVLTFETNEISKNYIANVEKSKIIKVVVGDEVWIHLRKFDEKQFGAYDKINWNSNDFEFVVKGRVDKINKSFTAAEINIPIANKSFKFSNYFIECFVFKEVPFEAEYTFRVVDKDFLRTLDADSLNVFKSMFL